MSYPDYQLVIPGRPYQLFIDTCSLPIEALPPLGGADKQNAVVGPHGVASPLGAGHHGIVHGHGEAARLGLAQGG
jgi:hypothetical protein